MLQKPQMKFVFLKDVAFNSVSHWYHNTFAIMHVSWWLLDTKLRQFNCIVHCRQILSSAVSLKFFSQALPAWASSITLFPWTFEQTCYVVVLAQYLDCTLDTFDIPNKVFWCGYRLLLMLLASTNNDLIQYEYSLVGWKNGELQWWWNEKQVPCSHSECRCMRQTHEYSQSEQNKG